MKNINGYLVMHINVLLHDKTGRNKIENQNNYAPKTQDINCCILDHDR